MTIPISPLSLADKVAQTSIDLYNNLRNHGKPTKRPNNVEEWTVLATISLVFPSTSEVRCVSLGTGVKVLPANRLPPLGDAVHDSHAEVLAKRGFVRWMMEEAKGSVPVVQRLETVEGDSSGSGSGTSRLRSRRKKKTKEGGEPGEIAEKGGDGWGDGGVGSVGEGLNLLELETILEKETEYDTPNLASTASIPKQKKKKTDGGNTSSGTNGRNVNSSSNRNRPPSTNSSPVILLKPLPSQKGSQPMSRETSGESTNSASSLSSFLNLPRVVPGSKAYYANQSLPMSKTGSSDSTGSNKPSVRVVPGSKAYYTNQSVAMSKTSSGDSSGSNRKSGRKPSGSKASTTMQSSAEDTDKSKDEGGKRANRKKAKQAMGEGSGEADIRAKQDSSIGGTSAQTGKKSEEKSIKDELPPISGESTRQEKENQAGDYSAQSPNDVAVVETDAEMAKALDNKQLVTPKTPNTPLIQDVLPDHLEEKPQKEQGEPEVEKMFIFEDGKFHLKDGVEIWLYVSTLPCGDASMLHTAAHQDPEVAMTKSLSPYSGLDGAHIPLQPTIAHAVRGRNGYDNFGAVRTKPGRADSTPTISLSCSDKIATWTVLGVQGALLEPLFDPVYLTGIVVGGVAHDPPQGWQSQGKSGKSWRMVIKREIERALWGRLGSLIGRLPLPYDLHPPAIHLTDLEFNHSKPVVAMTTPLEPAPSTLALSLVPCLMKKGAEILFNGTRQANTWKPPGTELLKPKARSLVCKMDVLRAYLTLLDSVNAATGSPITPASDVTMYDLKHAEESPYQLAKTLLRGLPLKTETLHAAFGKDLGPFEITVPRGSQFSMALPPFSGWIVSGKKYESFTREAILPPEYYIEPVVEPLGGDTATVGEVTDMPVVIESDAEAIVELEAQLEAEVHVVQENTPKEEKEEDAESKEEESGYEFEEAIIVNIPKRRTTTK